MARIRDGVGFEGGLGLIIMLLERWVMGHVRFFGQIGG